MEVEPTHAENRNCQTLTLPVLTPLQGHLVAEETAQHQITSHESHPITHPVGTVGLLHSPTNP